MSYCHASDDGIDVLLVGFHSITIDLSKTYGEYLFRLAESPKSLIIHESVKQALVENRPAGGWQVDVVELDVV